MAKLIDTFPVLMRELAEALRSANRSDLEEQIASADVVDVTFDEDAQAGSIYLEPIQTLNVVEANVIGVRYGSSIPVSTPFDTVVDLDNFGRVTSIEVLSPGVLAPALKASSMASRNGTPHCVYV